MSSERRSWGEGENGGPESNGGEGRRGKRRRKGAWSLMVQNGVMMEMRPGSEGVRVEEAMAGYLAQTSDGVYGYECRGSTYTLWQGGAVRE